MHTSPLIELPKAYKLVNYNIYSRAKFNLLPYSLYSKSIQSLYFQFHQKHPYITIIEYKGITDEIENIETELILSIKYKIIT